MAIETKYPAHPDLTGGGETALHSHAAGGATKEFFIPVTFATAIGISNRQHIGGDIDFTPDKAYIEFYVPSDFSSITEAVVVRQSNTTATKRLNYTSYYGAEGEDAGGHTETLLDQDTAEIFFIIYEQDISGILSSLAAGDYVSIKVTGDAVNTPDDVIFGVRLKYA